LLILVICMGIWYISIHKRGTAMTIRQQISTHLDEKGITAYQLWKELWPEFPTDSQIYTFLKGNSNISIRRVDMILNHLGLVITHGEVEKKDEQQNTEAETEESASKNK